uniref:RING-type domain-containing protein n=1 Tax=Kalanchoe fedtschenkoi TaxID=63787 RepID=A0A7N0UXT6_KALFE
MGCTVKDKHVRANRKIRSAKSEPDHSNPSERAAVVSNPGSESVIVNRSEYGLEDGGGKSVVGGSPSFHENGGWGYCTEEQLEGFLLRNLEFLFREAIATLVRSGHDEEVALKAVLKNGHCYGSMDALSNIVHNAVTYLNSDFGCSDDEEDGDDEDCEPNFENLSQLAEYSLSGMVCLLQQIRPQMSKGDALWCLLMGDLHLGRASQVPKKPGNGGLPSCGIGENDEVNESENGEGDGSGEGKEGESGVTSEVGIPPGLCRFHGGWGFGNGKAPEVPANNSYLQYGMAKEIQCPKRFDLPPPLKSMLKRNVAAFAAGFQSNSRKLQTQSQPCPSSWDSQAGAAVTAEVREEHRKESDIGLKQDAVISILNEFQEMKLDEKFENMGDSQKEEMIATLRQQIKDLEKQVEERREWAREKAMQAARKLSSDLTELKILRMEREEETQRLKKGKQNLEDSTMKRLSEMESALRKASGQVDRANAAVRRLENENAELRAELEAAKLSASEYLKICNEISKREKKTTKRLLAWEKQKTKLQEEITAEKKKITDLRQEIIQVEQAQKETEAKLKQQIKAKEQALAQVEELRRTKDATEAEYKRRHEALRLKIEIDFQRHKDDLQRLEQELSRLKLSAYPVSSPSTKNSDSNKPHEDTCARMLNELDLMDDSSETEEYMNRECVICKKDEVSVVFLPCAHQVICASCNETYGRKGRATCPCCRTSIEQRICVFGASS